MSGESLDRGSSEFIVAVLEHVHARAGECICTRLARTVPPRVARLRCQDAGVHRRRGWVSMETRTDAPRPGPALAAPWPAPAVARLPTRAAARRRPRRRPDDFVRAQLACVRPLGAAHGELSCSRQ